MTTDNSVRAVNPDVDAALQRLVEAGTIDHRQADAVAAALAPVVGQATEPPQPPLARRPAAESARPVTPRLRTRLSEIAGYVGAALVAGAAVFFLSEQWTYLETAGRIGLLAGIAVVLWAAAVGVVATAPGGAGAVRTGREQVRRRLASTLLTAAGLVAGFAAGVALDAADVAQETTVLGAALAAFAAVVAGYAVAPSLAGHLGAAAAAVVATTATVTMLDEGGGPVSVGLGFLALGAAWTAAVGAGLLRERVGGTLVAGGLALLGAQLLYVEDSSRPWSYALTLLVVVCAFGAYTRWPSWPLLGVGVVGATALVPEFLGDVTGGSLGVSGAMLAAGVALLASSALGLRLRRETHG